MIRTVFKPFITLLALAPLVLSVSCRKKSDDPAGGGTNNSAWEAVNAGIQDKSVSALAIERSTSTILAATTGGLYSSSNNGSSWTLLNSQTSLEIQSLLAPDATTYLAAGSFNSGIKRSVNAGTNWTTVGPPTNVWALMTPGNLTSQIFAGMTYYLGQGPLMTSSDKGATWTNASTGLPSGTTVWALTSSDAVLLASVTNGVYRSTNNGGNWTLSNTGLPAERVKKFYAIDSIILAAMNQGGVYRSANRGLTWSKAETGLTSTMVLDFAAVGNTIYAGTASDDIFQSTDKGATWTKMDKIVVNASTNTSATPNALLGMGDYLYAGTSLNGVYRKKVR